MLTLKHKALLKEKNNNNKQNPPLPLSGTNSKETEYKFIDFRHYLGKVRDFKQFLGFLGKS